MDRRTVTAPQSITRYVKKPDARFGVGTVARGRSWCRLLRGLGDILVVKRAPGSPLKQFAIKALFRGLALSPALQKQILDRRLRGREIGRSAESRNVFDFS